MSLPLQGKVALITGGSKGIGRASAIRLAKDGAKVVINYASSSKDAEETVSAIGSSQAFAVQGDAGDVSAISKLVDITIEKFGRLDIVIACAGLMVLNELEKVTEEEYERIFALNVKGPLFLAQVHPFFQSLKLLSDGPHRKLPPKMTQGGRIVFFSTTQCKASTVTPNYLVYCASKGAVEQLTRVLSKDLAAKGIMVNCVAPGPTATDLFLKGKPEKLIETIASLNPQKRLGKPEEIADTIAFLSGSGSAWVTGQVLYVNGGHA